MASRDLLIGFGLGAAVAFIADPRAGRRRRKLVRDQVIRAGRKTRDAVDATARDLANRTAGVVAATRGRLTDEEDVDDIRLVERVRARLGHVCSHPRAIDVEVAQGNVTLRGPILAREMDDLLTAVSGVRGVRSVTSALEPHDSAEGIPALQGDDIAQRNRAPATQVLVAAAGVAATGICIAAYARR
ncbi:MAG TPA: hypothetical protein VFK57_13110 [Vicinamibacterales bacterium]|nr:hypothetical protein [Vicinamibacterales bacterium]